MKLFLIIFFFVFCECDATTLFESISNKFSEYGKILANIFKPIGLKIKQIFFPDRNKNNNKAVYKRLQSSIIAVGACELAIQHGKKMETHIVNTKDEYFITLHRLTPLKGTEPNNVVFFHHGLLGSSADWLLLGPEKALPYLLLNEGYDVWLMNARGNYYSYPIALENDDIYWNFTWQEMGIYDLPVVIDYIMKVTNTKENLTYIGHSMGTTVFVTMLSFFPKYNANFKMAILIAPLVFMSKTKGPLYSIKAEAFHPTRNLLSITGIGEFVPRRRLPLWLAERYCDVSAIYCTNPLLFLTGVARGIGDWNKIYVTNILQNVPAGGSTNTILHYAQMMKSRKFHQFQNKRKEISLKSVTVPIVLMSSTDDIMSNTFDVAKLSRKLPCPIDHYTLNGANVTHMDFVFSPNADVLIYAKVLKYLHQGTECQRMAYHKLRSNNQRV